MAAILGLVPSLFRGTARDLLRELVEAIVEERAGGKP
jgi:hypothetical protein